MENHPGMEKLELLQQGKLRGAELLKVLRHLENCDHCYENQPAQDPEQLLKRLFRKEDEEEMTESDTLISKQRKK